MRSIISSLLIPSAKSPTPDFTSRGAADVEFNNNYLLLFASRERAFSLVRTSVGPLL